MKHKLMISIEEDLEETEEDIQLNTITDILLQYQSSVIASYSNVNTLRSYEQRNQLIEKNNSYLNQLLTYMESDNYRYDYSYSILTQIKGLASIAQSVFLTRKSSELLIQSDLTSEWKLLKLITEDQKHKDNLIDISKTIKRNNRYSDLVPYKYNCIAYQSLNSNSYIKENQDDWYINASYIDGPFQEDERAFIATQGPLTNTVFKFWQLCNNSDIKLILMLCSFEEEGRKKCDYYLPTTTQPIASYDLTVSLDNEEWIVLDCLIKRELTITLNGVSKKVYHLQMTNWPDHSAPGKHGYMTIDYIIKAIAEFRESFPQSPILTHCSAGTGRTGTLIAIFNLIKCLSFYKNVNEREVQPFMSVFNMVRKLREQRPGMVSSSEQYKYIYQHMIEWSMLNLDFK